MRLGRHTNGISCEYDMQDAFKKWLISKEIPFMDELRVREVHRIADFVLLKGKKLVNVEAKCNDFTCMLKQLDDHSKYCDYCFAYIPDYSITPSWFKGLLAKKGYGLIVYNYENGTVTEVLEAHYKSPVEKELKKEIIKKIKSSEYGSY